MANNVMNNIRYSACMELVTHRCDQAFVVLVGGPKQKKFGNHEFIVTNNKFRKRCSCRVGEHLTEESDITVLEISIKELLEASRLEMFLFKVNESTFHQ